MDDQDAARVVIVGGGFAGLFAARALRTRPGRGHAGRPSRAPPVPAAALPVRDRHPVRGPDRRAAAARCSRRHRNVECVLAEVIDIDAAGAQVIAGAPLGERDRRAATTT